MIRLRVIGADAELASLGLDPVRASRVRSSAAWPGVNFILDRRFAPREAERIISRLLRFVPS
jgi:hypothetical protein